MSTKPKARCPACNHDRDVDTQRHLREAERHWGTGERAMRDLALQNRPQWFWACDRCIRSGRALVADPRKQTLAMGTGFAAYVDRPFRCEDCDRDFVFGAREQRHWFETLGFWMWVHPKQCAPCRRARRQGKAERATLAMELGSLDPTDAEQLDRIAGCYEALGSEAKAEEFRARARNVRRRSE